MKCLACIAEDDPGVALNVDTRPDKVNSSSSLEDTNREMLPSRPVCEILVLEIDKSEVKKLSSLKLPPRTVSDFQKTQNITQHDSSIVEQREESPSNILNKAESADRDAPEKQRETTEDPEAIASASRRKTGIQQVNSTSVNASNIVSPPSPSKRRRATTKLESSPILTRLPLVSRGCKPGEEIKYALAIGGGECTFSEDDCSSKPARRRTRTDSSPQLGYERVGKTFPLGEAMHALSVTSVPSVITASHVQSHREADSTCDNLPSSRLLLPERVSSPSDLTLDSNLVLPYWGTTNRSSAASRHADDQIQPLSFASFSSAATGVAQESLSLQHELILDESFCASTKQVDSKNHFEARQPLQELWQPKASAIFSNKAQIDYKLESSNEISFSRAQGNLDVSIALCNGQQPSFFAPASMHDAAVLREQQIGRTASSKGPVLDQMQYQPAFRGPNCRNRRKVMMKGQNSSRQVMATDPLHNSVRPPQAPFKHRRQDGQEQKPTNCLHRMVGTRRLGKAFDPNGPEGLPTTKHPLSKLLRLINHTEQDAEAFAIPEIVITPPSPTELVSQEEPAAREDSNDVILPRLNRENRSDHKITGEVLLHCSHSPLPSSTFTTRTAETVKVSSRGCEDTQRDEDDATGLSLFKVHADSILSESLRQTHAGQSFDIARRLLQFLGALMDPVPTFSRRSALPQPWQEKYGLFACRIPSLCFQISTEYGHFHLLLTPTRAKERLLSMLQQVFEHIVTGMAALLEE